MIINNLPGSQITNFDPDAVTHGLLNLRFGTVRIATNILSQGTRTAQVHVLKPHLFVMSKESAVFSHVCAAIVQTFAI